MEPRGMNGKKKGGNPLQIFDAYDTQREHPALVELCLHCRYADCIGVCKDYRTRRKALALAGEIKMCKNRVPRIVSDVHDSTGRNMFEYKGTYYSIRQLAKMLGMPYQKLYYRLCQTHGDVEAALDDQAFAQIKLGKRRSSRYEARGESHTLDEWSEITGIPVKRLSDRLYRGHNIEEALNMGVRAYKRKGEE